VESEAPSRGPGVEFCYRHPSNETGVHCTRCGRPICTECMIPAPVGYQCPECVAEARRAFRQGPGRQIRSLRPTGASIASITLGVLVVVFVIQVVTGQGVGLGLSTSRPDPLLTRFAMVPGLVAQGEYYRLVTAMFLHLSILHILFNGWALLIFGRFVEQSLGRVAFAIVFLVGGFCGSVASYLFSPPNVASAGASGAIVALFGAFIAFNFRRRESALSRANLQSALIIIALNLALTIGYRQIDWRAHLGGLVGGLALGALLDGIGPSRSRRAITVVGVAAVLVVAVVLVVVRTSELRSNASLFG
jgi:membrane associated rhomboid family serine protease